MAIESFKRSIAYVHIGRLSREAAVGATCRPAPAAWQAFIGFGTIGFGTIGSGSIGLGETAAMT